MSGKSSIFITFLKDLMRRRRRNLSQLAVDLDISHATVGRWLRGEDIPNPRSCLKLAEYSGVSTESILAMVNHLPVINKQPSAAWPEFREYAYYKYPDELDEDVISMIEDLIERRRKRKFELKESKAGE